MKTATKLMAGKAASVLELLGLLQGEGADGAQQPDEHQEQTRDRYGRAPKQHRACT
jgi:hypothetical protein